ncbi:MAG: hypothetical protein DRP11_01335 [Candidatus Aenigmatarchaeota archaeon]|nr:MAG: hypothetical protein DRP11_01335 [Candidatus Aenigmarchaeota archaeon]
MRLDREEIEKLVEEVSKKLELPEESGGVFQSKEYRKFREEEEKEKELTLYEKACRLSERILKINPGKEKRRELQRAIEFAYLKITPEGAYSFAVLVGLIIIFSAIALTGAGIIPITLGLFVMMMGGVSIIFLANYPVTQANLFRVKASSDIILAIIYIVVYMRTSPNLEGAIRFAAKNLTGPLSLDFKKILWDVETRKYESMEEALVDYMDKWRDNQDFVEAINLIKSSMEQTEERRKAMLDEAINVILRGTKKQLEFYVRKLRMPIMIIHALGIMLPILIMVMLPIVILLLHESIDPTLLIVIYDLVLPITIYLVGMRTLEYRPFGFSAPDTRLHPKYSPIGRIRVFLMGKVKELRVLPFGLLVSVIIVPLGIYLVGLADPDDFFMQLSYSLVITWGIGLGAATYFIVDSHGKMNLRKNIKRLEEEFSQALFVLGNRLSLGKPIERAMEECVERTKEFEISNMFRKAVENIRNRNVNLYRSFFDRDFGAIWNYPSRLILNIMKTIIDAARKGPRTASVSSISISRYLIDFQDIEEKIKDSLSTETSSMVFLGMFLAPLVAGVTVTMAVIMIMIFHQLGGSLEAISSLAEVPGGLPMNMVLIGGWGAMGSVIPVSIFQVVVGIYVLETAYLLSMLASGIENGPGDVIAMRDQAGWTILIALITYSFSMLLTYQLFGSTIESIFVGGLV